VKLRNPSCVPNIPNYIKDDKIGEECSTHVSATNIYGVVLGKL
jgi:hypothetical protein